MLEILLLICCKDIYHTVEGQLHGTVFDVYLFSQHCAPPLTEVVSSAILLKNNSRIKFLVQAICMQIRWQESCKIILQLTLL